MDPPAMMNEGPYNLAEIWQFPVNVVGGPVGLSRFADLNRIGGGGGSGGDLPICRKRKEVEGDPAKAGVSISNGNGLNDGGGDAKRIKTTGNNMDESCDGRAEVVEPIAGKTTEQKASQPAEPPKQDYIHVRARRGQATDSHSLAERARREKISERMKILQDLVPGCNKVIGKALVLDEIINYIQSLQHQVEFLSMKLEAVNSRMTPGIEVFPMKDFGQQTFDPAGMLFGSQVTREYSPGPSPEWLHMQVGGGFERTT